MNILFLCSMNQWRSPTAERIYANTPGIHARSAGLSSSAVRRVSERDLEWADHIFVMEDEHKRRLKQKFRDAAQYARIHVLDIPDDYSFMDEDLIEQIQTGVQAVLDG